MEVVVLVCFLIAIVISLVGGLEAFLQAGCSEVYIIDDETVCTTALHTMKKFLPSFWSGEFVKEAKSMSIEDTCSKETLLTCSVIATEVKSGVISAIIGGVLAAVFSFQLILETATLHEYS